jgi:heterotetrameric sarcosine oxidase gamma subunit
VSGAETVALGACGVDIVGLAALRGRAGELERVAMSRGVELPPLGRVAVASDTIALGVRPERWLILTAPGIPGAAAAAWREACVNVAAAVDLSSGLAALHLAGSVAPEVLARGCRLDLHPEAFCLGRVAATVMAQVSVILAMLHSGWLLLTPSTTARHFHEWLASAAQPFGLSVRADLTVNMLFEQRSPQGQEMRP